MAPENEKRVLAEMLAGLSLSKLRVLSKRYGMRQSRIELWRKSKDQLIEDLLAHTDELVKGHIKAERAKKILKQGQTEIQACQVNQKEHVQKTQEELKAFLAIKIAVRWWDVFLNSILDWAALWTAELKKRWSFVLGLVTLLSFYLTLFPLDRSKTPDPYQVTVHVLEENGSHAIGATVNAAPWLPVAKKAHWLLTVPIEETPEDTLTLTAKKEVRFAQNKRFSVTLKLRYPNAIIRGRVFYPNGEPVAGARISVFGYENEAIFSGEDGSFSIPAHAVKGTDVRLALEKGNWGLERHYQASHFFRIHLKDKSGAKR